MSTELAPTNNNLPAHLQKYRKPQPNVEQFGQIDASDIGINMLKVGQDQSRECKKAGWGVTGQEPQIPRGSMFLSKDGKIIAPGTGFIPLIRTVKYIYWIGRPGDGRLEFMCDDPNDPRIKAINGLAFEKDANTGQSIAPKVTKYINFYVMLQGVELPVLLSFKRTSIADGKWLTNSVLMATQSHDNIDMFCLAYTLNQPKLVKDGDQDWYALSFSPAGFAPDQAIAKSERMAELAKNLAAITSGDALEGDEAVKPLKSAHPEQQTATGQSSAAYAASAQTAPTQQPVNLPPAAQQFTTPPAPPTPAAAAPTQTIQSPQAPPAPEGNKLW